MERDLYVSLAKQASDLVDQGEYAKAIEIFERIAGSDLPDFDRGITWVNLATVEDKRGDCEAALACLAREVAREWAARALAQGMDLGYEGDDSLPVQGQPVLLREALNNLIDNALHYAGPGATVTVRVGHEEPGRWALLLVEDDGPGVPAEHLGDLFARFWRGSDKAGGCGLGLSIVEEIALRHGGRTVAEGVVPRGLRVGMRLPAG